jgi:dipeptidyl aminopeptidase/acylaminoacyl peptidase
MKLLRTLAVVCCLAAVPAAMRAADAPSKLATYAALPATQHLTLSPDGSKLGYVLVKGDSSEVTVIDIKSGKGLAAIGVGEQLVRELKWSDNDNLVFAYSSNIKNVLLSTIAPVTASILTVSTGKQRPLLTNLPLPLITTSPAIRIENGVPLIFAGGFAPVVAAPQPAIRGFTGSGLPDTLAGFVAVEYATTPAKPFPESRGAAPAADNVVQFIIKPNGQVDGSVKAPARDRAWLDLDGGGRLEIPQTAQHGPVFLGYAADGVSMILESEEDADLVISQVSRDPKTPWTKMALSQGDDLLFDRLTGRYWGAGHWEGDRKHYSFVKPEDAAAWAMIEKTLPGPKLTIESVSDSHKQLIVEADSPTEGPTDYLIDLTTSQVDAVGKAYPGLSATDISPVRSIAYKTSDGLQITGYLTVPAKAGANPRGLPLVVLPHEDPFKSDRGEFDWLAQALASQGYAVLQPNFRGSTGLGHDLLKSGLGEWGKKMQSDLSDGVAALAGQGVIDPKRVCIMGLNYGGYAALAGVSITQGGYRCAIAIDAPTDLPRYVGSLNMDGPLPVGPYAPVPANELNIRNWNKLIDAAGNAPAARLAQLSPAAGAAYATAPVLLIHAQDDEVVPYEQAQVMAAALTKAGKPVQLVTIKGKDHALDRADSRTQVLSAAVAFLQKNNPPN